ncbi:hypothetical protein JXI42_00030 [bacterium]|nr:hypothetical protein [bacterium]
MKDFREQFNENLKELLYTNKKILASWEGGSAATGYLDEFSDLDLCMVCDDDAVEEVIVYLEEYLEKNYGIRHRFRMPEPVWHGHSQCFYILDKTPPLFYLDVVFMKLSSGNKLLEPDRHGNAVVWFDKANALKISPTPEAEIEKKGKLYYSLARDMFDLIAIEARKQILRGNKIDAFIDHNMLVARFLAYLLNLKYRPAKYDFGLRYANREYPAEVVAFLEDVMIGLNFDELETKMQLVERKFYELLEELKPQWG